MPDENRYCRNTKSTGRKSSLFNRENKLVKLPGKLICRKKMICASIIFVFPLVSTKFGKTKDQFFTYNHNTFTYERSTTTPATITSTQLSRICNFDHHFLLSDFGYCIHCLCSTGKLKMAFGRYSGCHRCQ